MLSMASVGRNAVKTEEGGLYGILMLEFCVPELRIRNFNSMVIMKVCKRG